MSEHLSAEVTAELRRVAQSFRHAAANPAPSTLPAMWVEGFCDGLKFAAAAIEELATGSPSVDAIATAMRSVS